MKRKMIGITAGYMSGLFFVSFFTDAWQLIIPAVAFIEYVVIGRLKNFSVNDFAIVSMSFAVAFAAGELYTHYVYGNIISYADTVGNFSGTVSEYEIYDNDKAHYIIKGKINGVTTAISFYSNELDAVYGDRINIENCTFKKISGDYLFDSESYYKSDRIFLSAEKAENITVDKLNSRRIKNFLMDYRERIISDFRIELGDDCGGFLSGMVFGEKSFLDDGIKNSLYRTGTGHVMAVSGLHISVMSVFIMYLLKLLNLNKFVSFGLINIFMLLMVTMAKSPISAIRAAIMSDMLYCAALFRRQNDTFNSLATAVLVMSIINPYIIYSQGFVLSVAGTFGIGVFAPYMVKKLSSETFMKRLFRSFIRILCASVVIMPFVMLYFDEVSIISPITNVIIVPLCTVCIIMGMLYTMTGGLLPILEIIGGIIKIILFLCGKISESDFSYISCGSDFPAKLAFICVSAVVMIRISTGNRKYISFAIVLSLEITFIGSEIYTDFNYNKFRVAVVGRKDNASVVISYHDRNYVIDLDDYRNPRYVSKYISENDIDSIDYIILHGSVQSLYPSYINELDSVTIRNWLVYGNISPCGNDNAVLFNDGYEIKSDDYSITYADDILSIVFRDSEMTFVSAKSDIPKNRGFTIFYDGITKKTEMQCDGYSIYLDEKENIDYKYSGMNNFITEISENGKFTISNLK